MEEIGRLLPDGRLTGNFTADPGRPIEVDHLLGASMCFRRSVIAGFGGIHDGYRGTCVREESDLCLRVGRAGYRLVYEPDFGGRARRRALRAKASGSTCATRTGRRRTT